MISTLIFLLMFIFSGIEKVISNSRALLGTIPVDSGKDVARLLRKLPILYNYPIEVTSMIILLAGIWELVASGYILSEAYHGVKTEKTYYSAVSLIIFTVLATLLFYITPLKVVPTLTNLSIIGGLGMLCCRN